MILNTTTDVTRIFDVDYIIFDFILFIVFLVALLYTKSWFPLAGSVVCSVIITLIDSVFWYGAGIRVIISPVPLFWVYFMMDISYGILAFSWMLIMLEKKEHKIFWTTLLFGGWLFVPIFSNLISLYDAEITTIRYMASIRWWEIVIAAAGYILLIVLKYDYKTILYVFGVGCMQGFMMEFCLWITENRPSGLELLIYDTLVLINQVVPYAYVFLDKILPQIKERIGIMPLKEQVVEQLLTNFSSLNGK